MSNPATAGEQGERCRANMSRHSQSLYTFSTLKGVAALTLLLSTQAQATKHPAHPSDETPFKVVGGFELNKRFISRLNNGLTPNRYGTTTLLESSNDGEATKPLLDPLTGKEIVIRDQHYSLIDFKNQPLSTWVEGPRKSLGYGIRFLPATTGFKTSAPEVEIGGVTIKGSQSVDKYLREVVYGYKKPEGRRLTPTQLKKEQPIFAQIAYVHPEGYQGEPFSLANEVNLKTEMGFTHKGLYIGDGKTVNSPPGYHFDTWWDSEEQQNYPAFMSVMDYSGFSDGRNFNVKEFNRNGIMSALVLNETNIKAIDGIFPQEFSYKFDPVYTLTLEKVFDFYARWLENDPIFTVNDPNDPLYMEAQFLKTYCAEHATDITNILINLPQNLTGYKEVYGEEDGKKLFEAAMDKVYNTRQLRTGADAAFIRESYLGSEEEERLRTLGKGLTPYWKVLEKDLPAAQKTKQVVKRDPENPNRFIATHDKFKEVGYSLAWQPETVADLLKDFIQAYLPWTRVGSLTSVAAILGFSGESKKRMNIDIPQYVKTITPIVQQIFLHEAAMEIGLNKLKGESDESRLFEVFKVTREKRQAALAGLMNNLAVKMQSAERGAARVDAKVSNAIKVESKNFMALVEGSGSANTDKGWKSALEIANKSLAEPRAPSLVTYREKIYEQFFSPNVKDLLKEINKIDANPTPELTVKYYYAPAVHVRVAMGIHDAESETRKHVRLYPVGHVIQANEVVPMEGQDSSTINDDLFTELKVL